MPDPMSHAKTPGRESDLEYPHHPRTAAMLKERARVISISLSEAEWRAFVARQPRPVDWLRERILTEVAALQEEADAAPKKFELKN
jgi:hypothetical protein